jgi:hypothetical protein
VVAPAPRAPRRPPARLRGVSPLSPAERPFEVDETRLYEVGPAGGAWTGREDAALAAARLRRLRWLAAIGIGANALTWSLAGLAFALGGRLWGAAFGLLAVATLPLLALPALIEAAARLRAWRRHRRRPADFPPG